MGGVLQYSMSVVNSLRKNKKIKSINIYTNNKNLDLKECNIVQIKNFNLLFFLSIISGVFNFYPKLLFGKIDLLLAPSYSPILFFSKTKFVFTLHDLQEIYFPEYFTKTILFWRKFIYKKLTSRAFKIITESIYVKSDILRIYKLSSKKVIVAESPPFFEEPKKINAKEKSKTPYDFPYIFFPAQFWKHKNHIRVLDAFSIVKKKHPNIKLILTGNKSREYWNILKKIEELKLQNEIIFKGPISQSEMPNYFRNALLVIAPTLYESISIPVFEAFKYSVPVCASGVHAIKDQVGDAGLIFNPFDEKSIALSIIKLIENSKLQRQCVINGKKRLKYFSDERFNKLIKPILSEN
jgi:glycosyltransferase involved in cell wall biosynthesis